MHLICTLYEGICIKYAFYMQKYAWNMQQICTKYAINMHLICIWHAPCMQKYAWNMHFICNKYAQICMKYARNMQEICTWYAPDMHLICTWYAHICKTNMQEYARICRNMHRCIYCIFGIYMHPPLWWRCAVSVTVTRQGKLELELRSSWCGVLAA